MRHWMFNCKEVSRLVSESLDRKLPLYQRIGVRVHLLMCKFCRRFQQQLILIRETIRAESLYADTESYLSLPPEAQKRIKRFLRNNLDKP